MNDEPEPRIAEESELAKGPYALFFERNKLGIQYVNTQTKTYYISRSWTLRGPVPRGVRIEHTGLAGYRDDSLYDANGYKRVPRVKRGGTHSKRRRR